MYIVDDPTLALIARFVGDSPNREGSDAEFFRQQLSAIEAHVERFPAAEREVRALAWIEANARQYRQQWQKQAAISSLAGTRCPDCPIADGNRHTPCAIHTRWLALLRRYAASELSSNAYVEQSLALLATHKDRLKVGHVRESLRYADAQDLFMIPADGPATGSGEGTCRLTCRSSMSGERLYD